MLRDRCCISVVLPQRVNTKVDRDLDSRNLLLGKVVFYEYFIFGVHFKYRPKLASNTRNYRLSAE